MLNKNNLYSLNFSKTIVEATDITKEIAADIAIIKPIELSEKPLDFKNRAGVIQKIAVPKARNILITIKSFDFSWRYFFRRTWFNI